MFTIKITDVFSFKDMQLLVGEASSLDFYGRIADGKNVLKVVTPLSVLKGEPSLRNVSLQVLEGAVSKSDIGKTFTEAAE